MRSARNRSRRPCEAATPTCPMSRGKSRCAPIAHEILETEKRTGRAGGGRGCHRDQRPGGKDRRYRTDRRAAVVGRRGGGRGRDLLRRPEPQKEESGGSGFFEIRQIALARQQAFALQALALQLAVSAHGL